MWTTLWNQVINATDDQKGWVVFAAICLFAVITIVYHATMNPFRADRS